MYSINHNFFKLNFKQHLSILISSSLILLPVEIQALPSGQSVVAGNVAFQTAQKQLTITASNRAIINYNSFNIGSQEMVKFIQPNANSVVLNRVILANPSSILGTLNANGRVFLVNPAGIYFGASSVVNANSFLATTLNITDKDFLNDNYNFEQMKNMASSYVIQKGSISVSPEGFVVLAAPFVSSEGAIMAKSGHVVLGATNNFYIQFDTNGLIKYDYKETKKEETPILVPKEYANDIIDNIINTDVLDKAVKIVKNGDKISLVGAEGTALITSNINTDATESSKAGTIEVKAQRKAFILNNADLHANAEKNGNGGTINIFANDLSYSAKGASYSANGGTISGDGGYLEISAKDIVNFDGSKVSLYSIYGKNGQFVIDPTDLIISDDSFSNGANTSLLADNSITINDNIIISTRDIGLGSDYMNDASAGDSGSLTINAPHITVGSGSKLLTFADNGHSSGDLTLNAISNTADVGVEASSSITLNGSTLKGGKITLNAQANSQDHFDSTDDDNPVDPIEKGLDFLSDIPTLPVGLSVAKSKATVEIGSGTNIDGSSIDVSSNANSEGSVLTIFTAVGVGYGQSEATAQTTVKDGATLTSSGTINIQSDANSENSVKVYTVGLGQGRGSTANMSLAYAKTDTTSSAVIENGATISSTGTLNVGAHSSKSITASASAASYDNGTVGVSAAITESTSTTQAKVGGTINVNKLSIAAQTENKLIKTASSSAVGSGAVSGRVVGATNNVISKVEGYFNAKTPTANGKSGSKKPALSAAFSYADHSATTTAAITDNAVINVGTKTRISAKNTYPIDLDHGAKGLKTSATATIDSNDDDQKTYSVAGAVSVTKLDNTVKAYVGKDATLNSQGNIDVSAETYMPYEVTWGDINKVSDISEYINSNIGIQNGFFTTWAQSNSQGKVAGAAGSVNYFHMHNDTQAYLDDNAKINQNQNTYGTLRLDALTDLQSVNLAGVFGWKVLGASGEKAGLGGSYLDIQYDDTTKAQINDGVYAKAKGVSLTATTNTKNISIAEAGTNSEKYGAAGSFSYLRTNDTTQANINNANIVATGINTWADNLVLESDDNAKLFNVSGGIIKSKNVGIGASISINEITRDTESNVDGTTFENDGSMKVSAKNNGEIDAYSLASAIALALGIDLSKSSMAGQFGIGASGDVSLNTIDDTTTASLTNSDNLANKNNTDDISLSADDTTSIKSYAGSVSFSVSNRLSTGLAGSYSKNDITTQTTASIDSSEIYANSLSLEASNTGNIESYTASGSGAISGETSAAIAGSVSINNIENQVYSQITNSSDVTSSADTLLSANDTPTIKTVAGAVAFAGKAGVGASLSKNSIDDTVNAKIDNSKVKSGGSLDLLSVQNALIDSMAASLAVATNGMAASISVVINTISNNVKSWIYSDDKEISVENDINIKATNSDTIETKAGQLTASNNAGFGAAVLYNTVRDTIRTYVSHSNVDAGGNIVIASSSDRTIDARAAGGTVSGSVAGAGGVVINSIKDDMKSYVSNSDIVTQDSFSMLAYEVNHIFSLAGILSIGKTLGIGGAVLTNIIENDINAHIYNSNVKAKGNASTSTLLADGSGNTQSTNGLDVLAYGDESISSRVANVSGGGTAAVGASVSVNLMKDNTNAYVKGSHVNEDNGDANALQSARVRAVTSSDISALAGGVAAAGTAGVGASSDTSIIKNSTNAYIDGSFIYAKNLAQTTSNSRDRVNSTVVSGAFAGEASLAGSVAVVSIDNQNHAYTLNSHIASEGDLEISASDTSYLGTQDDGTQSGVLAGSVAIGGAVGLGGSVVVTKVKQDVQAHADDSVLNAKKTTSILANNMADFIVYAASGNLGVYAGAGGAVTINTADTTAKAYTYGSGANKMLINQDDAYKTSSQDVVLHTDNYTSINSTPGAVGGGVVGASGSVDVATIHNTSLAEIGSYSKVNAGRSLLVRAAADKRVYSNVAAGAGGVVGVSGAVSVANINTNIDSDSLSATDNTKDTTNTLITKSVVGNQMGDSSTATSTKSELDGETTSMSVNDEFSASSPDETTYARIGDNSVLKVGSTTAIETSDNSQVNSLTGAVAGGVVGLGGSVSIANIGADTRAYIGKNVVLESGSLLVNSNLEAKNNEIESYTAAAGAVGLGAAVSKLTINYENDAYSDIGANLKTTSGDLEIQSSSDLSDNEVKAYGAAAGADAVGIVKADLYQKGKTQAIVYGSSTLNSANNINIEATHDARDLVTLSQAAAGGIDSGEGSLSTLSASPTLLASLGDSVNSNSSGDTSIVASTLASLSSEADGVNVGGISVGVSKAKVTWKPTITSKIGSYSNISADNLYMHAYENMNSSGYTSAMNIIKAKALSATGALVGGTGSFSQANRDSNVKAVIGNSNQIQTNRDMIIKSKAYGRTEASSDGYAYGVLAGGFTGSTVNNKAQVSGIVGKYNTVNAGRDIQLDSYTRAEAKSYSFGGAGGLLSGSGTKATANVDKNNAYTEVQDGTQLLANNGDISLKASSYLYARAVSDIVTAGGVTINESEANTDVHQDIKVDVGKNTKLQANNINITADGHYIHVSAKANSKTTAADSTSRAYSNLDLESNTNVNIKNGAILNGKYSINVRSTHEESNLYTSSKSYGEIKAGLTGTVEASAHNNVEVNSHVTNEAGSSFTTKNLHIETYAPGQSDDTYKIDAVAKANTVVNWVLTTVDEKVKEYSKIPVIGWIVKWVWHKVKKWVKEIVHSDTSSSTSGDYSSDSLLNMSGDIHQKSSLPQSLNIATNSIISSSGEITAHANGNEIVVDDLINHDEGKILLQSNGDVIGSSDIYLDNKYPDITINNHSNKNIKLNNINVVSDNADQPNIEVQYGNSNSYVSTFHAETPSHTIHINNYGSGDVIFNGVIDNYAGDTTVYNQYGNIFANGGALLKTKTLDMNAYRGTIGTNTNAVEIELQKSDAFNPTLSTNSFYDTYLGLKAGELTNTQQASSYMIDGIKLSELDSDGKVNLNLHTANTYTRDADTGDITATVSNSKYYINNIDSTGNVNINANDGVSLLLDGTIHSGMTDQTITLNSVIDPYSRDARYIASQNANTLYLKDITQPGGNVNIDLSNGSFAGTGSVDTMDGHTHINVNNLSAKDVHFQEINTNSRNDNGFYLNGVKQQSTASISLGGFGYEKGAINIDSTNGGEVQLGGNINNQSGSTHIVANNGIYNMATNLVDSSDMMFDTSAGGSVGTGTNPLYVKGSVSTDAEADVHLYAPTELNIDSLNAQNVYLSSNGAIKGLDSATPNITADRVELQAQGDINSIANNFLTLSANTIAAHSNNGEIKLNNNKNSVIGTVGSTTGLHAANDISFISGGTLHQVKDANILSDNTRVTLTSSGDMSFDNIQAPNRVTLTSQTGAISQDGDSQADIISNEAVLQAHQGIGSNDALDTTVHTLDARNNGVNDIAINNHGSLTVDDLDADGYALYNAGGAIKITTDGALTQATPTSVFATKNIDMQAQNDIFVSNMKSLSNLKLRSIDGDILGDGTRRPNISVKDQLALYADNGVIGTPANPISIIREHGTVTIEASVAKNFLSTYIFGANAPSNNFLDGGLSAFDNRIVSGDLIEQYYGMLFNYGDLVSNNVPRTIRPSSKSTGKSHLISGEIE